MNSKKWKIRKQVSENLEEQILSSLGIENKPKFFNPDYERDLHDPFEMLGMEKAVGRILEVIKNNQKIVVYGDYDADGVCATAIFHDFFKKIGFENFDVYIPDKYKEGYGLNLEIINKFIKEGIDLIITVDCGISDFEEIEKAEKSGINVIVVDHHLETERLPSAFAVLDTEQKGDKYPFKCLCGAGMAFKTVNAILKRGSFNVVDGWNKWLLDVICIATIADMVSLTDENRALVFYGLEVLKKTQRLGLSFLMEELRINKTEITEDDIAFLIAPRINTAGRMDHALTALSLLVTDNSEEARWLVGRINEKNREQKELAGQIFDEINEILKKQKEIPGIIVLGNKKWSVGVLYVVNRVLEEYNRPVFLWGKGDGLMIKGSARIPVSSGVNLVELMEQLGEEFFDEYGGHALSAGFTLKEDKVDSFAKAVEAAFSKIKSKKIEDILWIDRELDLEEVNWDLCYLIEKFRPFGQGNPKPVFLLRNLEISNVKTFGNGGVHLQLDFSVKGGSASGGKKVISAIGFFMTRNDSNIKKGDRIDLVASVERSTFKGYDELRLRIVDMKVRP